MWGAPVGWVSSCKVSRSFRNRLTACVVTREDGLVLGDTVDVRLHDSAQEGVVQVGEIVTVTVAGGGNTGVYASGIAVPNVHVDSRDRGASAGINELDVEVQRDTRLAISNVATDQLAIDVVRALGDFRLKNAGGVVGEEQGLVLAVGDVGSRLVSVVVGGEVAADQRAADATLGTGLAGHLLATGEGVLHVTSATELRSARADRVGASLHELLALSGLFRDIMARVRQNSRQGEETKGQKGRNGRHF
jgi:hypothetical protein